MNESRDKRSSLNYRVGARIEAKYGGRGKWYKGVISRINSNGTYDVEYDDGDSERGIKPNNIRSISKSQFDADSDSLLSRGTRVEARYRGKSKWYKGKILRANTDGTYDIEYDDGDVERRVAKSLIREIDRLRNPRLRRYDDTSEKYPFAWRSRRSKV